MRGWIFGLACLAALGCGPTLGVRGRLADRARTDMSCDRLRRVVQLNDYAFEVDGCGMMIEYADAGVGSRRDFRQIRPAVSIAAEETSCALERLELVEDPIPTRRSFVGCGTRVSYELECADGIGCRWARDGEIVRAPLAPPPLPTSVPPASDLVVPPPPGAS